jgi:hypothetical protein
MPQVLVSLLALLVQKVQTLTQQPHSTVTLDLDSYAKELGVEKLAVGSAGAGGAMGGGQREGGGDRDLERAQLLAARWSEPHLRFRLYTNVLVLIY